MNFSYCLLRRFVIALIFLIGLCLCATSPPLRAQLSRAALLTQVPASVSASGDSTAPTVSADGRFVVFLSTASNLVTNDTNRGLLDVFLRNLTNGSVTLVSVNTNGTSGNGRSYAPSISADGQVIAFVSQASDLVPNDTNGIADIFVRDLRTASTRLVTRGNLSEILGPPVLTPDGRFVFFESGTTNVITGNSNAFTDIYRVDLTSGEIVLVSEPDPALLSNLAGGSNAPETSDDGNRAVFLSFDRRLAPDINGSRNTLFFRDLVTRSNRMVNIFADPTTGTNGVSQQPSLSSDGRVTAFLASVIGSNGTTGGVYRAMLPGASAELLAPELDTLFRTRRPGLVGPLLNRDGSVVFFETISRKFANSPPEAVYAWNATTRTLSLISSNAVTIAESPEPQPFGQLVAASADGRFVAWLAFEKDGVNFPTNEPFHLFVQDRVSGETRRITRTQSGQPAQIGTEFPAASFSADGRFLAFQSADADLVDGDANESTDVFLYDWNADRLELVSRRADTLPSVTGPGLYLAGADSLSADGRFLVFASTARGLTPDDTRGVPNVFVRDLMTGTNWLVSVNQQGNGPANGTCRQAVISTDGRWVAFTSSASNLVTDDTDGVDDVFVHDLVERKTVLASRNRDGTGGGNAESSSPAISPDGSRVAFVSFASDLVAGDTNLTRDVFVFERTTGTVRVLSATPFGSGSYLQSGHPVFSPDGAWIVFESSAPNLLATSSLGGPQVYAWRLSDGSLRRLTTEFSSNRDLLRPIAFSGDSRVVVFDVLRTGKLDLVIHDFAKNETTNLLPQATAPSLSVDENLVAYVVSGSGAQQQVKLLDRTKSETSLVSAEGGGTNPANARCFAPLITPDGRFVVFASQASNLVTGDTNGVTDVFVRDLWLATTFLLSRNSLGTNSGDALSTAPILSRDGRTVVFTSFATDLATGDFNQTGDLFVVRLPGPESEFRILTVSRLSSGEVTLIWAARQGATYRVEFADGLASAWQSLNAPIQITNNQATAVDATAAGRASRFYRLVEIAL